MGTVGDPKLDLGWVVQSWPEDTSDGQGTVAGYVDMTGMPSRTKMLERYAEVSGRQVDDMDYYTVLAKWKLAMVLEQGFQRAGDNVSSRPSARSCCSRCRRRPTSPSPPTTAGEPFAERR